MYKFTNYIQNFCIQEYPVKIVSAYASADLEVQLVQLNHCDGE